MNCYYFQHYFIVFMDEAPQRFILVDCELDAYSYHAHGWTFDRDGVELIESECPIVVNRRLLLLWGEIFEQTAAIPALMARDRAFLAGTHTLQQMMRFLDDVHLAALMAAGFHWGAAKCVLAGWYPRRRSLADAAADWLATNKAHPRNFSLPDVQDAEAHVRLALQ